MEIDNPAKFTDALASLQGALRYAEKNPPQRQTLTQLQLHDDFGWDMPDSNVDNLQNMCEGVKYRPSYPDFTHTTFFLPPGCIIDAERLLKEIAQFQNQTLSQDDLEDALNKLGAKKNENGAWVYGYSNYEKDQHEAKFPIVGAGNTNLNLEVNRFFTDDFTLSANEAMLADAVSRSLIYSPTGDNTSNANTNEPEPATPTQTPGPNGIDFVESPIQPSPTASLVPDAQVFQPPIVRVKGVSEKADMGANPLTAPETTSTTPDVSNENLFCFGALGITGLMIVATIMSKIAKNSAPEPENQLKGLRQRDIDRPAQRSSPQHSSSGRTTTSVSKSNPENFRPALKREDGIIYKGRKLLPQEAQAIDEFEKSGGKPTDVLIGMGDILNKGGTIDGDVAKAATEAAQRNTRRDIGKAYGRAKHRNGDQYDNVPTSQLIPTAGKYIANLRNMGRENSVLSWLKSTFAKQDIPIGSDGGLSTARGYLEGGGGREAKKPKQDKYEGEYVGETGRLNAPPPPQLEEPPIDATYEDEGPVPGWSGRSEFE